VRHSALASLAFEPDCLFRDKNSLTPPKARAEGLFGPVAESQRFPVPIKAIGVVAVHSKPAIGFALTLPNLLDCQRVIRAVVFDLEEQELMDGL
jgi:hypothetical protein